MIFLGLVLIVAALVVGAAIVLGNDGAASLSAFGHTVPGVENEWQVFLAGALVSLVFVLGIAVAAGGARRSIDLRRELRDLRDEHEESVTTLEMEKRQLQRELARARQNAGQGGPGTVPNAVPAQRVAPPAS
ncbi:hypothetical protein [Actinomadura atramentaria]|uniref:hypothetical protein n=1 Tax=Actinomadura atramentaria TaxID=1990 RepID=UPI0003805DAD|nr:hypothetical protein [Actinomadura atramentaria]